MFESLSFGLGLKGTITIMGQRTMYISIYNFNLSIQSGLAEPRCGYKKVQRRSSNRNMIEKAFVLMSV